jgi:hypothetical protein
MKKNIGPKDRRLRFTIALLLFGAAYWKMSWILFAAGLFVLFEAVFSWCIVYQLLGKNSCSNR